MLLTKLVDLYVETAPTESTSNTYRGVLDKFLTALDETTVGEVDLTVLTPDAVQYAFNQSTVNRKAASSKKQALTIIRGWLNWLEDRGDIDKAKKLTSQIKTPKVPRTRRRAITRSQVLAMTRNPKWSLRNRVLVAMLYETGARSKKEVLSLDVEDLDFANRKASVVRKGGDLDRIIWGAETARLLKKYLAGRTSGPLFVTERASNTEKARVDQLPTGEGRLSYEAALKAYKVMSKAATGKAGSLHDLRHTCFTHLDEAGVSLAVMKEKSGHRSTASLLGYTRPDDEGLADATDLLDPANRKAKR